MFYSRPIVRAANIALVLLGSALSHAPARGAELPAPRKPTVPIAKIKESVVCCPSDRVLLDGWASIAPGGEITTWEWDVNGDHAIDTTTTVGEVEFLAPDRPCSRTVYLTVKDKTGALSAPDSVIMHVMNSPPRVSLRPDTTIKVGVRLMFEPRIWCNCSAPASFEWDFNGDGQADYRSVETANTSRVYYKPGKYTARFRVVDELGREGGGIQVVRVLSEQPNAKVR